MDQKQKFCKGCNTNVLATRKGVSHTFHLILTLVTGVWGFIWAWQVMFGGGAWRCQQCGRKV